MVAYSFQKRFVAPIRAGLGLIGKRENPCEAPVHPKRQTIRAIGKRRHARPGETLQLYTAMRTKYCELIGEARCVSVDPVQIHVREPMAHLDIRVGGELLNGHKNLAFAQSDGFEDCCDMWNFWRKEHGSGRFEGVLIQWEAM